MNKQEKKEDWVCREPFEYIEIFQNKTTMCCPQWLPENLGTPENLNENWKSNLADNIRESVTNGTYKYCNENTCPKLNGLKLGRTDGFIHKKDFPDYKLKFENKLPIHARYTFDESCNLKCPSCRKDFIKYTDSKKDRADLLIKLIESQLGKNLEKIDCTGSGDPFFSQTFKKWLMTLDKTKYPKLNHIHLHTNGTLWNESNWAKMKNVHDLVKSCEISIDAATKETYENFTRLGGKWEPLISNLNYIANIPTLDRIQLSFVVQQTNYKEMRLFYDFISSIFSKTNKNWKVFYNRVSNWGTFTPDEYKHIDVANPNHPEAPEFIKIFKTLPTDNTVMHNLPLV